MGLLILDSHPTPEFFQSQENTLYPSSEFNVWQEMIPIRPLSVEKNDGIPFGNQGSSTILLALFINDYQ
jgi:hypothetical protein